MKRKAAMKRKGRVKLSVVVIEIEVPTEIDSFTKFEILDEYGRTYKSWIQQCYLHRMKEILTNPTEFGKVILEEKEKGPLYPKCGFRGRGFAVIFISSLAIAGIMWTVIGESEKAVAQSPMDTMMGGGTDAGRFHLH